jgi:CDP-diacylglycerol---serine O-phosphatidyltransferase
MRQRLKYLIPNAVTVANIVLGFLAIVAAAEGAYERGAYLLFGAAMCDMLDGRLARLLNASSKFGMELDSLSDMVSFGIAPAVLVYLAVLRDLGTLGAVIASSYLICGALRLARFNLDDGPLTKITFQGLPIPVAAGYLISFIMVRGALQPWLIAGGVAYIAGCMVSTTKIPKFRKGAGPPIVMLFIGLATFVAFLARPSALTWHIWNGWNFFLVGLNYIVLYRQGYLGKNGKLPSELKRAA